MYEFVTKVPNGNGRWKRIYDGFIYHNFLESFFYEEIARVAFKNFISCIPSILFGSEQTMSIE